MTNPIAKARVKINNRLGLHARPAMSFVELACTYESEVSVSRDAQTVDGKSIMQMMLLAATQGTEIEIVANGKDAEQAISALCDLVNRGFDDDA
jgi:phosphocarrier protein